MIRQAIREDAEGLAALLRSLTDALPRFAGEPPEATLTRVSEALTGSSDTLLVAESDVQVSGFVHTHWHPSLLHSGGEGFVSALFVHPRYRGQGLGQALLERIQVEGNERGCSRLLLLNMRNRASYERGFYAKLGWQERPEAANFVFNLRGESK